VAGVGVGVELRLGFIGAKKFASEDCLEVVIQVLEQLGVLLAIAPP
jgi:hypothetical protein